MPPQQASVLYSFISSDQTKQVCDTTYIDECIEIQEKQCTTSYEEECRSSIVQNCTIVHDQKCSAVYEDKCTTELVEECYEEIEEPSYKTLIYMFYPAGEIVKKCQKVPKTICR